MNSSSGNSSSAGACSVSKPLLISSQLPVSFENHGGVLRRVLRELLSLCFPIYLKLLPRRVRRTAVHATRSCRRWRAAGNSRSQLKSATTGPTGGVSASGTGRMNSTGCNGFFPHGRFNEFRHLATRSCHGNSLTNFAAYFHRRCVLRPTRLLALLFEPPHARVSFTGYGSQRPMSTFDQSVTFRWGSRVDSVRFRVHFSRPGQRSKLKNSFRQDLTSAKVSIFRRSVACVKHFLFWQCLSMFQSV